MTYKKEKVSKNFKEPMDSHHFTAGKCERL